MRQILCFAVVLAAALTGSAGAQQDQQTIAAVAHKLKGLASTFAAPRLENLAKSLEHNAKSDTGDLLDQVANTCDCADATASALKSRQN